VLLGLVWAFPAIGVGILVQSANRFATFITGIYENESALARLHELARLSRTGQAYRAHFDRLFPNDKAIRRQLPHFEGADAAVERAIARMKEAIDKRKGDYVKNSAVTVALATFIGALGPISSLKPNDPSTNHAADILKAFFPSNGEESARSSSSGGMGAAFASTNASAATEPSAPTEAFDLCRDQSRHLDDGMPMRDRKHPEEIDEDAEVLAYALGQIITCQQFGGGGGPIVVDLRPRPLPESRRPGPWDPGGPMWQLRLPVVPDLGDADQVAARLNGAWQDVRARLPEPLVVFVRPELVEDWRQGIEEAVSRARPLVVPAVGGNDKGTIFDPPEPRETDDRTAAGIPEFCAPKLASFYFAPGGGSADDMICGSVGEDACRAASGAQASAPAAAAELAALVRKSYPHLAPAAHDETGQLLFVGYTDSTGNAAANTRLAGKRAASVRQAIGISDLRASAIGRGEEVDAVRPASGLLLENPLSRRVDVFYCDPEAGPPAAP
jgi:hypothetical protein